MIVAGSTFQGHWAIIRINFSIADLYNNLFLKNNINHTKAYIYFCRKYALCRESIDIPSISCSGYEPYEYSWTNKDGTNGINMFVITMNRVFSKLPFDT